MERNFRPTIEDPSISTPAVNTKPDLVDAGEEGRVMYGAA